MAKGEYYDGYGSRNAPKERRGFLLWLLDGVMAVCSVIALVLLVIVWLVPRIHPAYMWALPMLGLVAPGIYLSTVILALYWVVRWRLKRALVLGIPVLIGLFSVSLFWRSSSHRYELLYQQLDQVEHDLPIVQADTTLEEKVKNDQLYRLRRRRNVLRSNLYPKNSVKILSYNLRSFYGDDGKNSADGVAALIDSLTPDIVCLQEFALGLAEQSERFQKILKRYRQASFGLDGATARPQMILTTHKMINSGVILTPRSSVWADILLGQDTVRVISTHLHSTGITALDDNYITGYEYLSDTAREAKIRSIMNRFSENTVLRAYQVDSIRHHLDSLAPRLRIICGDFNDTPISYTYREMARNMQDAFSACGSGYSYTFRGFFNMLRIDYVLLPESFEAINYEVPEANWSDHRPVFVRFQKQKLL